MKQNIKELVLYINSLHLKFNRLGELWLASRFLIFSDKFGRSQRVISLSETLITIVKKIVSDGRLGDSNNFGQETNYSALYNII